jgi:hypothetical protein
VEEKRGAREEKRGAREEKRGPWERSVRMEEKRARGEGETLMREIHGPRARRPRRQRTGPLPVVPTDHVPGNYSGALVAVRIASATAAWWAISAVPVIRLVR